LSIGAFRRFDSPCGGHGLVWSAAIPLPLLFDLVRPCSVAQRAEGEEQNEP
jgi:hypothetical protein